MVFDRNNADRSNDLWDKKSIEDLIGQAERRIRTLHSVYGDGQLSSDARLIEKLTAEARSALSLLGEKFDALSDVFDRMSVSDEMKDAQIITTLWAWLDIIQRMKKDAASKH